MKHNKPHKTSSRSPTQGRVTNNIYSKQNSKVHLTYYLDSVPPMTQYNNEQNEAYETEEEESFSNLPDIFNNNEDYHSSDSSASQETAQESDFSPQAVTAKLKFHNYRNEIPASLRKPYRDPRINKTGILQPSFKTPPKNRVNPIITEITPNTSHKANTETPQINKDNGIATENSNSKAPTHDLFNLKFKSTKIYVSPYLEDEYKPNPESFKLTPDLAPLLPLIMSQHEVFAQHIIDLSKTNLTLTKVIEKKKESFIQLENNKKIPKSLRIKVELTTSPTYTTNQDFIQLKEKLQTEVSSFIEKGTDIMKEWAKTYIKLLTNERCLHILNEALEILNGLASFYADIIGTPDWPSASNKKLLTLFMLNSISRATSLSPKS